MSCPYPYRDYSFAIVHPDRKNIYLAANTAVEFEEWKSALISVGVKLSKKEGKVWARRLSQNGTFGMGVTGSGSRTGR